MALTNMMSFENPVFRAYVFYCSVLCLKMLFMSVLTAMQRFKHKAFANPEDAANYKLKPRVHDDVERVRRAHLNDMENILVFFVAAWLYTLTNPSALIAVNLFRVFTACRLIHTAVYAVVVIPQPARALSWGIGYFISIFMSVSAIVYFM